MGRGYGELIEQKTFELKEGGNSKSFREVSVYSVNACIDYTAVDFSQVDFHFGDKVLSDRATKCHALNINPRLGIIIMDSTMLVLLCSPRSLS